MPRVIVIFIYYRPEKAHRDIGGLLEYIAKREGVETRYRWNRLSRQDNRK